MMALWSDGGTCVLIGSIDYPNAGGPFIRWLNPLDGRYFLAVENADAVSTGAYTLNLATASDDPTDDHGDAPCSATAINPGDEITGKIDEGAESD
jgi:hypothetical protein